MAGVFDDAELSLPCPKCKGKTEKTVGWVKAHKHFTCSGCGGRVALHTKQFVSGLESADRAWDETVRALKNLGK